MSISLPRRLLLLLALLAGCGPHIRTCDVGCGDDAYCDEPSQLCVLLLEDGGRYVEPSDGGTTSVVAALDAGDPYALHDGGTVGCTPGTTRACAVGCGATQTCDDHHLWGPCGVPTCAVGLECKAGQCVCTTRCDGCCLNAFTCVPGNATSACGSQGRTCSSCLAHDGGVPACVKSYGSYSCQ